MDGRGKKFSYGIANIRWFPNYRYTQKTCRESMKCDVTLKPWYVLAGSCLESIHSSRFR
jgi:hypothetical protein